MKVTKMKMKYGEVTKKVVGETDMSEFKVVARYWCDSNNSFIREWNKEEYANCAPTKTKIMPKKICDITVDVEAHCIEQRTYYARNKAGVALFPVDLMYDYREQKPTIKEETYESKRLFPICRDIGQPLFDILFDLLNLDYHGWPKQREHMTPECDDTLSVDNELFSIRPYYWGDDEDISRLPNFVYKLDGTELYWYKYPCRSMKCSRSMKADEFRSMIMICIDYVIGEINKNIRNKENYE